MPTLNRDLADLDAGREIELPTFDFHTGSRSYKGRKMRLDDDQVVVLEGIHSLNPDLTPGLPDARKFHVYISALTQLNLDNNIVRYEANRATAGLRFLSYSLHAEPVFRPESWLD